MLPFNLVYVFIVYVFYAMRKTLDGVLFFDGWRLLREDVYWRNKNFPLSRKVFCFFGEG